MFFPSQLGCLSYSIGDVIVRHGTDLEQCYKLKVSTKSEQIVRYHVYRHEILFTPPPPPPNGSGVMLRAGMFCPESVLRGMFHPYLLYLCIYKLEYQYIKFNLYYYNNHKGFL